MFDDGLFPGGLAGSILPAVRPEIAESFKSDMTMVIGTILAFLVIGFIVARVGRVIKARLGGPRMALPQDGYQPQPARH